MTKISIVGPITRSNRIRASRALGLLLLLSCFAIPRPVAACDTASDSKDTQSTRIDKDQKDPSSAEPDYYRSADNPFFGD